MGNLRIADREFNSRLLIGTGKFASCELMAKAIEKSGTEKCRTLFRSLLAKPCFR